jgi:Icc-related predicted phosphoesterase
MRIAFTSDVHTDHHTANRLVWQEMVTILQDLAPDVFICCGDIAAEEKQFGITLMALERVACPKLFVPGNHDVWVQKATWVERGITSQQKYYRLLPALCRAAGVHPLWLEPYILGDVAFCGSLGWYDYSLRNVDLDTYVTVQDYRRKIFQDRVWNDGRFVHWLAAETPGGTRQRMSDKAITAHMVQALARQLQEVESRVQYIIGVTHMLPFRSMMHYRHEARADYFGAFMGSVLLGELWQSCPKVIFALAGHTHRKITIQVGHTTALTSPVGYAQQWDGSTPSAVARDCLRVIDLTIRKGCYEHSFYF